MEIFEKLEFLIRRTSFNIFKYGRKIIGKYNLSKSQFDVIVQIYFNGLKSLKELCTALDLAPSTLSEMIDRMEKKSLLVKKKDTKDKRKIKISLTNSAKEIIDNVINTRIEYVKNLLKDIDKDKLDVFKDVLQQMLECQKKNTENCD